ncbi:Uncharacterised protein [Pseudomonas fluorescens]|uniref:Phage protein n=1 Tax=Pseudomonas fluorescens TaxID=294 RepID=A0A448DVI4_PSEFL|nr:hypothetical protein [Pseudomonas fluorescens]VEF10841.1 Uncharacterised protein [Pseudomonas fluorescens]
MALDKTAAWEKAKSHLKFLTEAKDEQALTQLFNGAVGYCYALRETGLFDEAEIEFLIYQTFDARADWYRPESSNETDQ